MTGQTAYRSRVRPPLDRDQVLARRVANRLASARAVILSARGDPEILSRVAACGYPTARLAGGLGLCLAAETAFEDCQEALCSLNQAAAELERADAAARQAYIEFRMLSRLLFSEEEARAALGVEGDIEKELQKFVRAARAGYETAAGTTAYQQLLAQYGSLEDACASIDELLAAHQAYLQAGSAARWAVERRDQAAAQLDEWIRRFLYSAKTALRSRPDLLRKLRV